MGEIPVPTLFVGPILTLAKPMRLFNELEPLMAYAERDASICKKFIPMRTTRREERPFLCPTTTV